MNEFDILYPLRRIHGIIFEKKKDSQRLKIIKKRIQSCSSNDILLILTPTHGNLGDHAIVEAESALFDAAAKNLIEVTDRDLIFLKQKHCLSIMNGHPIVINGGGFIGTLWIGPETLLKDIITNTPDSKIIMMPNTAFFEHSNEGKKEYEDIRKIFLHHQKLLILSREQQSYNLLKKMGTNTMLVPDVVFSLKTEDNFSRRMGCLLILRQDCEKLISDEDALQVERFARDYFDNNVCYIDTVKKHSILPEKRHSELNKLLKKICTAELVITDRLHGMIFSAITATPCVVINSKSPKVMGCYKWIEDLEYVQVIDNVSKLKPICKSVLSNSPYQYSNIHLQPYFDQIVKQLAELE